MGLAEKKMPTLCRHFLLGFLPPEFIYLTSNDLKGILFVSI